MLLGNDAKKALLNGSQLSSGDTYWRKLGESIKLFNNLNRKMVSRISLLVFRGRRPNSAASGNNRTWMQNPPVHPPYAQICPGSAVSHSEV